MRIFHKYFVRSRPLGDSISFWQNDSADTSSGAGIQSRTLSASCRLLHHSLVIRLILQVILEVKP